MVEREEVGKEAGHQNSGTHPLGTLVEDFRYDSAIYSCVLEVLWVPLVLLASSYSSLYHLPSLLAAHVQVCLDRHAFESSFVHPPSCT